MNSNCKICNKTFIPKRGSKGIFCSLRCYWVSLKGNSYSGNRGKRWSGMSGKRHSQKYKEHMRKIMTGKKMPDISGEEHHSWKGSAVGYRALHSWVERQLGRPSKCSECNKVGYGHKIHWANISGEYKRELTDWVRLCSECHGKYDKKKGLRKHFINLK